MIDTPVNWGIITSDQVSAIRLAPQNRLKNKYPVHSSRYYVETIHSFSLRFVGAYPKTTELTIQQPQTSQDYAQIISSAINLFDTKLGKDILRASYSGIFVDEYQDCGIDQHELICKLAEILPCRIVGDPLQGIYDFNNNQIVDWEKDVFPFFDSLPELTIPYRWKNTCPELGERLRELRRILLEEKKLPIKPEAGNSQREINSFLKSNSFNGDSIFVLCEPTNVNYTHWLAGKLGNRFKTIEPVTSNDLVDYACSIESLRGIKRLNVVIKFCNNCLIKITESKDVLSSFTGTPKKFTNERKKKLEQHFKNIIENNELNSVYDLVLFFEERYDPTYKRHQLWKEMKKGLSEVVLGGAKSLEEAVWNIRNQLRFKQNRIPRRCISRTVLLKGLECDHSVIIKPELFDKKNLYVALTRASSKVTIISNSKAWANY